MGWPSAPWGGRGETHTHTHTHERYTLTNEMILIPVHLLTFTIHFIIVISILYFNNTYDYRTLHIFSSLFMENIPRWVMADAYCKIYC